LEIRSQSESLIFWTTCWGFGFKSNDLNQRSPYFLDAGPNSQPYHCLWVGLFRALKKQNKKTTRITLLYIAFCFLCLITCFQTVFCNCFFCCKIVVTFRFMLNAAICYMHLRFSRTLYTSPIAD